MISVITVNYKTKDYLERMLESLYIHHDADEVEVFVVDNASGDDLSAIESKYDKVTIIYSNKNVGFAAGCNMAIKLAAGDYYVLINPDIEFTSPALSQIEQKMKTHPEVGIGGVSLKNLDGSQQDCVWRFPRPLDQLLVLLKAPHVFKNLKPINQWLMKDFDYSESSDVDQVMGAFFCIRREMTQEIGLLDDGFFMWYEEVDYCKRAANAEWRTRYFADIEAKHKKGSSFDQVATLKKQSMVRRSLRRYMKKHFGLPAWLLFTLPEPFYITIALLVSIIKPK
jgi:N-acetylglucosaminyl-diphospho-decaprenol L-rhamnosyltransferase